MKRSCNSWGTTTRPGPLDGHAAPLEDHGDDAVRDRLVGVLLRDPGERADAGVQPDDRVSALDQVRGGDLIVDYQLVALRDLGGVGSRRVYGARVGAAVVDVEPVVLESFGGGGGTGRGSGGHAGRSARYERCACGDDRCLSAWLVHLDLQMARCASWSHKTTARALSGSGPA